MKKTVFISLSEALELHRRLIERFGGKAGVRDQGLLESALFRPQTGYYKSLSIQAAALLQSLAINHPFFDGNKRVAFSATAIFLRMNGYRLVVTPDKAEAFLVGQVIQKNLEIDAIATWLEKYSEKV